MEGAKAECDARTRRNQAKRRCISDERTADLSVAAKSHVVERRVADEAQYGVGEAVSMAELGLALDLGTVVRGDEGIEGVDVANGVVWAEAWVGCEAAAVGLHAGDERVDGGPRGDQEVACALEGSALCQQEGLN